ncbi:MAG: hypothetical protein V7K47_07140 [Nostoc sp.]
MILLFGASGVFAQLQDALNRIWSIQPKPGLGFIKHYGSGDWLFTARVPNSERVTLLRRRELRR